MPGEKRLDIELFSEAPSRIILSLSPDDTPGFRAMAEKKRVPLTELGKVVRGPLAIGDLAPIELADLREAYESAEPTG